jgi:hypothetical protein
MMAGVTVPGRYAIIPTRNRPTELAVIVGELHRQGATVVVVDNGSNPPASPPVDHDETPLPNAPTVIVDHEQPPNLSRFWNLAFDEVEQQARMRGLTSWDVGVFNDDTVIPAGWFDAVTAALRSTDAAAACSDPYGTISVPTVKVDPDRHLLTRMCPWAFVVRGELGWRADEDLRWWFGDTDADWAFRRSGGVAIIPGYRTQNVCANSTTIGVLAEQAGRDRQTFQRKHGWVPW